MSTETNTTAATEAAATKKPKRSFLERLLDNKYSLLVLGFIVIQIFALPMDIAAMVLDTLPMFKGMSIFQNTATILAGVLMAVWFSRRFKDTFDGISTWSTEGLKLALPTLSFALLTIVLAIVYKTAPGPMHVALIGALAPGVSEEVVFRGLPISNWMRIDGKESSIIPCALATGFVFGLIHCMNALAGAPISSTIFQFFYATCLGVSFAAVFLRTGSIWPSLIMHTLIDFAALCFMDPSTNGRITQELTFGPEFFVTIVLSIGLVAYGLYLLRPEKRADIVALWDKKWSRTA